MIHSEATLRDPSSAPRSAALDDPFARALELDELDRRRFLVGLAGAITLYAALAVQALVFFTGLHDFATGVFRALSRTKPLEYQVEPPPEPVKAAPPPKAAAPAAPPAAAQAGKVLTADPDPDEPVDLTQDGFVQGTADSFAGGVTATNGTSHTAVRDLQATGAGEPVAVAVKPVAPKADLSRAATPLSGSWDHCGFPAEADMEQVNSARVVIAVTIAADGHAQSANVVQDPGYGFGALAKRCALREHFSPALGRDGSPITATQVITINFRR